MTQLTGFLTSRALSIAMSLLSSMFINALILHETLYLSKRKAPNSRFLVASFLISLATLVPIYAVSHLYACPQNVKPMLHSALMYASPLYLPLYYWIYRAIIGAPRDASLVLMESVLQGQYIGMLIYQALFTIWSAVLPANAQSAALPNPDLPAMACATLATWAACRALKAAVNRTGNYILIPHDYPLEQIRKGVPSVFLTCVVNYLMLVFATVALGRRRASGVQLDAVWVYVLLIGVQVYHVMDRYHGKRLQMLEWHAKATELYTDSMMHALDEFRKLHHDLSNVLQVYGGYIAARDMDGLTRYHGGVIGNMLVMGSDLSLIEALRPRAAVYNLLAIKIELMRHLGIRFEPMGVGALCGVTMNDLDLCHMLEALLDNAIRSAAVAVEKRIVMACRANAASAVLVTLSNTTAGGGRARSWDESALSTVRSILLSRDCGDLYEDHSENWFTASVLLRLVP